MFLKGITIQRVGKYGAYQAAPTDPLEATVEIFGEHGETKLKLGAEAAKRLLGVISDEMVASAKATAEAMTTSFVEAAITPALSAPQQKADRNTPDATTGILQEK